MFQIKYLFIFTAFSSLYTVGQNNSEATADSLFVNGNFSKAIDIYEGLDGVKEIKAKIAKAYIAIGNYDEALEAYKSAIEESPDDDLLKYDYAKLLSKTKKFKLAEEQFNQLMNIDYRNPNYHYELGLVLEKLNDSTALNRFRTAYDLDKTHQKAIFKIAKDYLVRRLHEQSHKYIDVGLSTYENNVELISLKAQNYYWQENYKEAIKWFKKLLQLNESSEFIHEKLSLSYYQEYDYHKALEHRLKVLEINPLDAVSMYVIGTYYEDLKDLEKAEDYIKRALLLMDRALDAEYTRLGIIYNRQKRYGEAIEMFKIAIKEDPETFGAPFYMVMAQDKYYKDIDERIKVFETFKKKFPKSPFKSIADKRIKELKEEKFMQGSISDSLSKN